MHNRGYEHKSYLGNLAQAQRHDNNMDSDSEIGDFLSNTSNEYHFHISRLFHVSRYHPKTTDGRCMDNREKIVLASTYFMK